MKLTQQEANAHLSKLVADFNTCLHQAEAFADEYRLSFCIEPAYGMGGCYNGDRFDEGGFTKLDHYGDELGGWHSSSQSC